MSKKFQSYSEYHLTPYFIEGLVEFNVAEDIRLKISTKLNTEITDIQSTILEMILDE